MAYAMRAQNPAFTTTTASSQAPNTGGFLSMPEFAYTPTEGLAGSQGTYVGDYFGQMANDYLPKVDQFAKDNTGKMVDWSPDQFMTVADFTKSNGIGASRGDLRGAMDPGYYLGDKLNQGAPEGYFAKNSSGQYNSPWEEWQGPVPTNYIADGTELFTSNPDETNWWDNGPNEPNYTSAGTYRKETDGEAWNRKVSQGGVANTESDFGGDLTGLTKDQSHKKWGSDAVNMPELAQYINDPNWVQRNDTGDITGIRAELLPYVFRDELSAQFRDLTRGGTKESETIIGGIIKAVAIGMITMGAGYAAIGTLGSAGVGGLTTAGTATGFGASVLPAGTALSTTGSVVSGAIGGGINSAITGGDVGVGMLTGGVGGGVGKFVSGGIASTGVDWLDKGTLVNDALTRGTVSSAGTFARGGDAGDAGASFIGGAGSSLVMDGLAYNNLTTGIGPIDSVVGNLITQTIGGAINTNDPAGNQAKPAPAPQTAATPATQATPTTSTPSYSGGRVNYVKK